MSGRPTILVVFPYGDEYGPFRTLRFVLRGLEAAGYNAVCVLPEGASAIARLTELGVGTRSVRNLGTFPRTLNPARLRSFFREHFSAATEIERIASAEDAKLIYSLSEAIFCGSLAATRRGLPSVVHVIGLSIGSPTWVANLYIPTLHRVTTHFVACSAAVADMLARHRIPESRISVVHSGVSIAEIDATLGLPSPIDYPGPKLGMVAAYDPRKGHQLFVAAAAKLVKTHPDARFYIIGGVLERQRESIAFAESISELIDDSDLAETVFRVGRVASDEIYPWIRALDLLVLPSRTEAFGYVQFEAMACARPVIATRLEGNLDAFVDGDSGIYVGQSPEEIAAAAHRVLTHPELAMRLGAAARERVTRFFNETEMIPVLAFVVESVLRSRRPDPPDERSSLLHELRAG